MIDMIYERDRTKARDTAIAWSRRALRSPFIVFDLETTGLVNPDIVQVGIVDSGGRILYEGRIKPSKPIEPGATKAHGLTDEDVKDCPPFEAVYEELRTIFGLGVPFAYNYAFDEPVLLRMCAERDLLPLVGHDIPDRCAMHAYAAFNGEWNAYHKNNTWKKLTHAAQRFRLEWTGGDAHDAAADSLMTVRVIRAMARTLKCVEQGDKTALELAQNNQWSVDGLIATTKNGRVGWTSATDALTRHTIRLERNIETRQGMKLKFRYVQPDELFILKLDGAASPQYNDI